MRPYFDNDQIQPWHKNGKGDGDWSVVVRVIIISGDTTTPYGGWVGWGRGEYRRGYVHDMDTILILALCLLLFTIVFGGTQKKGVYIMVSYHINNLKS